MKTANISLPWPHRRAFLVCAAAALLLGLSAQGCSRPAPEGAETPKAPSASERHAAGAGEPGAAPHAEAVYVCPMHPQVIRPGPGRCPICGMDLVARSDTAATHRHDAADGGSNPPVTVSAAVIDQLGVRTAPVRRGELKRHIQGFGVFVRNSSQAYRPTNQGFEAGPGDSGQAPATALLQGQIFEREAPLLRVGQRVRVRPFYLSSKEWTGKVLGFETQVNQSTRTQVFHVAVDTGAASVPSGMTANLSIELDPIANVLLVPREAVIRTGQGARVVVALGEGRFKPRPVQADDLGEDEIVIRSGLNEGEQVVVSAQFLLDSEANLEAGLRRLDSTPREHNPAAEAGQ